MYSVALFGDCLYLMYKESGVAPTEAKPCALFLTDDRLPDEDTKKFAHEMCDVLNRHAAGDLREPWAGIPSRPFPRRTDPVRLDGRPWGVDGTVSSEQVAKGEVPELKTHDNVNVFNEAEAKDPDEDPEHPSWKPATETSDEEARDVVGVDLPVPGEGPREH